VFVGEFCQWNRREEKKERARIKEGREAG